MDHSKEAVYVFNDLADVYEAKYMNIDERYFQDLDFLCDRIAQNGKVLELACGPGNLTKYILNRRSDLLYKATDLSENMIALAKKNNPGIQTKILDCRNLNRFHSQFDAIVSGFCLPYLNKNEVLKKCSDIHSLLRRNGLFYLSGIEGNYDDSAYSHSISNPKYKVFMHYYSVDSIAEMLIKIGFELLREKNFLYKREDNSEIDEFAIMARKV